MLLASQVLIAGQAPGHEDRGARVFGLGTRVSAGQRVRTGARRLTASGCLMANDDGYVDDPTGPIGAQGFRAKGPA